MITYSTSQTIQQLQAILALQKENLERNISSSELNKEGYVTAEHNLDLISKMNKPYAHIIATDAEELVGYALVMTRAFSKNIPVLVEMFDQIDDQSYRNGLLGDSNYVVMGQICIAKAYRGRGIFYGLYNHMREIYSSKFEYLITMVAERNQRSLHAHYKAGFCPLHEYNSHGEHWHIILLDWT